jgi:hypothetical protein
MPNSLNRHTKYFLQKKRLLEALSAGTTTDLQGIEENHSFDFSSLNTDLVE